MQASVPSTVLGTRSRRRPLVHDGVRSMLREQPREVDRICFEYLRIEMAATLAAGAAYKTRRANDMVAQLQIDDPHARVPPMLSKAEEAELAQNQMESVGMHVGACLVEQLVPDRLRTTQTLDNVKFVCKELWIALWDKQIDNLRTNHRGMFVLQDVAFRPLLHATNAPDYVAQDSFKVRYEDLVFQPQCRPMLQRYRSVLFMYEYHDFREICISIAWILRPYHIYHVDF